MKTHLIAVGVDKTKDNYTNPLNCCVEDANAVTNVFTRVFRLDEANITRLFNSDATVSALSELLNKKSSQLKTGDTLVLFFSGHGGQVIDYNKDEKYSDFDSTLCFYERMLLDDEIHNLLCEFEEGVNILFFSDSCHSGTVNRGEQIFNLPEGAKYFQKSVEKGAEFEELYKNIIVKPEADLKASLFFLSACKDDEYAFTGNPNSVFTSKLIELLEENEEEEVLTFKFLALLINRELSRHANQTPQYSFPANKFHEQLITDYFDS